MSKSITALVFGDNRYPGLALRPNVARYILAYLL
ncbi:hypothetical protein VTL71DRAFT_10235 [Oculimacula yallundae]|uniref:Uncharacterized protein n=1 Tax=Oculimacula yallundae TaxID=86028 RepID=A0ABR4BPI9_9HELO